MRISDWSSDVFSSDLAIDDATALGYGSYASAGNSVALGAGSVADRINSVSVGDAGSERQITNVAAGTGVIDAVNLAQLQEVAKTVDKNDHFFQASDAQDNPGVGAYGDGTNATAAGEASNANGPRGSACGSGAFALDDGSSAYVQ